LVGAISPAMQRNKVDFPDPERPSRATISPSRSSMLMPSNTGSSPPSGAANVLVTRSTSMIAERFAGWAVPIAARLVSLTV
jgi:hypothetical protein